MHQRRRFIFELTEAFDDELEGIFPTLPNEILDNIFDKISSGELLDMLREITKDPEQNTSPSEERKHAYGKYINRAVIREVQRRNLSPKEKVLRSIKMSSYI